MPEIGEIVDVNPFSAAAPSSSGGGPQIGDVVDHDPFDPANYTNIWGEIGEVGRGIPAGAVQAAGTALRGFAANQPTQRYANYLDQIEHGVLYRTREREGRVPVTDDTAYSDILQRIADDPGMFQSQQLWLRHAIEGVRSGNLDALSEARSKLPPEAVQERELWRAGEAVSAFAEENFPAKPGYEDSLGRMVGEGLGSLGAGLTFAAIPGVGSGLSTTFFTAMGSGEAADRAVAEGATDEQIVEAAGLGAGAGATDILPAEMLLGRIPGANVIANAVKRYGGKRAMQAIGRISNQALVESVQEGGQQTLQNLIAQEVYKPEQQILEGVVENAGIGGIVGGIAGLGREGVYQLSTRRSSSARGDRARRVREVPPPSPEDEASPIPTADIIEGRERIADAEATENANKYLEVAGLPQIGQPVRVVRGRDAIEGVVSDAWEGDDPGLTVRAVDGSETDLSLAQMQQMGATLTGLPMPASRAEIESKAQEIAADAEQVRQALAQEEQRAGVEPDRRREVDQIMADVRQDAERHWERGEETPTPAAPTAPPAPDRGTLPQLTRAQVEEVSRLTRAGVPPGDAVRQVMSRAGVPPGDQVIREPMGPDRRPPVTGAAGRPEPDTGPPRREPVLGPLAHPTDRGPERREPVIGPLGRPEDAGPDARPVVVGPQGRVETGGPDSRPVVIGPAGRPDATGPEARPVVVGPSGFVESGGPDSRPLVVGPQGRVEPMGPDTRPAVVGPSGRPETSGPNTRPLVVGPDGFVQAGGPDSRPLVIGPNGRVETGGPDSRPVVVGPSGRLEAQGPETRPQVTGPQGRRDAAGPETRPVVVGPSGRLETAGPESRPIIIGPDGFAEAMGPETRPVVVGPSGRLETSGPDSRPLIIGPSGRIEGIGPETRPEVVGPAGRPEPDTGPSTRPRAGEEQRWLQQVVAEATGRDFDEARGLAEAVAGATGQDIDAARGFAEDVFRATGRDMDRSRALAQAISEATGQDVNQSRALAQSVAAATGRDFDDRRALAMAVSEATGADMNEARGIAEWVADASGTDMDMRRAIAEAVEEASGQEITPRRALAEAIATATGRDVTEARGLAQAVAQATGRDVDNRRALAQAIAESSGRDIDARRALAQSIAEATGGEFNAARALAEDVARATGSDINERRALAEAVATATGRDIDEARALAPDVAAATGRDVDQRRALAESVATATGRDVNETRAFAESVAALTGQDIDMRRGLARAIADASGQEITPRRALAEDIAAATGADMDQARAIAQWVARATGRDMDMRRALAGAIGRATGRDIPRDRAEALAADDRRQALTFEALRTQPTAREIGDAAEEAGLPPDTATQIGEQVADALRPVGLPGGTTPTPEMVSREVQATGLPADFGDRIARLVAERQGMADDARQRAEQIGEGTEARRPRDLPEDFGQQPERAPPPEAPELGEPPTARAPRDLPADFAARIQERVNAIPEVRDLPDAPRERLARRIEEIPEIREAQARRPQDVPADMAERIAERVAAIPEVRTLPPNARERVLEEVRQLPEGFGRQPETAPLPEPLPPPQEREARRPRDLPEDFAERIAEKVAATPEVRGLPVGFADRIAERVAAIPDVQSIDTMDLAERVAELAEIRDIPPDVRNRMAARVAVEVRRLPAGLGEQVEQRGAEARQRADDAAERAAGLGRELPEARAPETVEIEDREARPPRDLPEDFGAEAEARAPRDLPPDFGERIADRVAAMPEIRTLPPPARETVSREIRDLPPDFGTAEVRPIPEELAQRVIDVPAVRAIPETARQRLFERIRQEVEDQIEPPDVALGAAQTRAGVPPGEVIEPTTPTESAAPPPALSPEVERAEGEEGLPGRTPAPPPPIMRKDGQPYATERSAALAARTRGIDADPVEVDGGWGLQEAGGFPTPPEEPARTRAGAPPGEPVETEVREVARSLLRRDLIHRTRRDFAAERIEPGPDGFIHLSEEELGGVQDLEERAPRRLDYVSELDTDEMIEVEDQGLWSPWDIATDLAERGVITEEEARPIQAWEEAEGDLEGLYDAESAVGTLLQIELENQGESAAPELQEALEEINQGTPWPDVFEVALGVVGLEPAIDEMVARNMATQNEVENTLRNAGINVRTGFGLRGVESAALYQANEAEAREALFGMLESKGIKAFKYRNRVEGGEGFSVAVIDPSIITPAQKDEIIKLRREQAAGRLPEPGAGRQRAAQPEEERRYAEPREPGTGRLPVQEPEVGRAEDIRAEPAVDDARGAPPQRVRIRVARQFDEQRARVHSDLNRIGRETFGQGFNAELAESITTPEGDAAPGAYDPQARIAYIAMRADEEGMTASLMHEGVHYLRGAGAFTRADGAPTAAWRTLENEARTRWREQYNIDQRYGDTPGLTDAQREDLMNEEAVAEALADFATRGRDTGFGPTVRMALTRVMRFFRGLASGLRGRGFRAAESIMEGDILTGAAGRRADEARKASPDQLDRYMQTAWHGSPHRFDEFSTAAIGTGEGAQVYGWGLYFADKRDVADWYRAPYEKRGKPEFKALDRTENDALERMASAEIHAAKTPRDRAMLRDKLERFKAHPSEAVFPYRGNEAAIDTTLEALAKMERAGDFAADVDVTRTPLYRVDLAPKDSEYLHWDRSLHLQPKGVRNAVNALWARQHPGETMNREEDGGEVYQMLAAELGSQQAASEALLAEGVRGIKYLDQSSRPVVGALGRARVPLRETFNYVIFDDSDVAIQEIMLQRRRAGQGDLAGTERLSETGASATDIESPNILFQRGAKEDPKAFDKEASDWSGVDLTGAAEEVVKDKDRMGGFGESVKAGLKGTTAIQDPAVKVKEEKTHKDLNLAWRFLAPPLAWSKKYPAIHALIRQGVDTEKEMSNRIQRLNRDWDRITKKLSKDEFAQLTGILFMGDAEAVTFTDEQLGRFNTTEKVRDAYKESRKFLDKIGRFTEQHERSMALPLLTRRTTLVRQMAGERGMDKAEFRELYNTRAELLGQQRRGEGNPRVLEFEIGEATESVFGGQEAPSELFMDRLKEADRLETRIADTKVRRREGYVPHKFFGRWRIFQAAQPNDEIEPYMGRGGTGFKDRKAAEKVAEASEGGILEGATPVQVDGKWGLEPKWKEVAGEHGLWKTRTDAVRAASHMAREGPEGAEIRVVPVEFEFPHDSATTLGDAAYFTFRSNVERLTGLSGEELNEVVTGAARRPFRRRIAGFLQYRTGMTGYSLDLDRVMRTHVGETVRYASLDRLKFDAINTMEKEGLSAYRSSIQDRPVLAAAVQAWFRDVNGQKQQLESQIDNVLNKSWVTPLRAGLAAGALGFLAAGGPFNAPISPIVGAYVGYRVGRGLAQGGDFKTRAITGSMLGDMAHLKLGAFFNLMSALVNTSQVPLNTLPVLGVRDTAEGAIRYQKAVLSKLRGRPNADYRFLERMDINPLDTFAEGTRHKFKKESKLSKISMVFFSTAEGFNRGVTALGALNKAQRKGWSHGKAKSFANETLDRTQFHYGASDKPELLRNVVLRVPLQFKNFVAHQLAFVFGLNRKELPLFLLSMALTAGALGIPGLDFVDTLTDWLFDFSPIAMMKEAALDAAVEGELEGGIATFLTRGVPGLAGVDMTGRVGMGDKFLPMQFRDWKGPWISTVESAVRHGREEAHWTHQMRNLSPGLGNPLVVLDAWQNGGQVRSPWKRNRPEYVATETELMQKLAGARPIREARLQDLRDIERRDIEGHRIDKRRYVDRIVRALDRGDREAARAIMQEALDAGVPISSSTIRTGIRDFGTQRALREFDRLPRGMKPEGLGRREAIERMAQ